MILFICGILKKEKKIQNRPTDIRNKLMVTEWERKRRNKLGVWD